MTFCEIEWRKKVRAAKSIEELENLLTEIPADYNASSENELPANSLENSNIPSSENPLNKSNINNDEPK